MPTKFNEYKCKHCPRTVGVIGDHIPICHGYMVFTGNIGFEENEVDKKPKESRQTPLKKV